MAPVDESPLLENDSSTSSDSVGEETTEVVQNFVEGNGSGIDEYGGFDCDPVYSLTNTKTTPKCLRWLVPIIIVITHLNFAYGQVADMWYLYFGVDFQGSFEATSLETKLMFDGLGLKNPFHVDIDMIEPLDNFTYGAAINKLWKARGLEGKTVPRIACIILILFSGIWPHLKLLLLNFYWHVPVKQSSRTTAFYWLSTFGKFSIADVFVVCALVAVCNLNIDLEPESVLHRIEREVPLIIKIMEASVDEKTALDDVCNDLLHLNCSLPNSTKDGFLATQFGIGLGSVSCTLCYDVVTHYYENPAALENIVDKLVDGIDSSGGGIVTLRVAGLRGIHVFCVAVLTSLILGLIMEVYDHIAKHEHGRYRLKRDRRGSRMFQIDSDAYTEISMLTEADADSKYATLYQRSSENVIRLRSYILLVLLSAIATASTAWGMFAPTMIREVPGSIPNIINETLAYDFDYEYSLWSLTNVVGEKGGWDIFLMYLFGFFCMFGPLIRASLTILQLVLPLNRSQQKLLLHVIDFLGVFCALDVLFISLYLVDVEMPPITNTIIDPRAKFCKVLHRFGFPEACLKIEFHTLPYFSVVAVGWFTLAVLSAFVTKLEYHALDPYKDGDRGGPYFCERCPSCFWDSHRDRFGNDI
uniref:Uncharacterized protein n=1 Tax=Aplanochytrium stocchinoi TaxID=215587 RepID=A0A6S8D168_9STRA